MSEQIIPIPKPKHGPQRYSWRRLAVFNTYDEADTYRHGYEGEHPLHAVKVVRIGPDGLQFAVKLGKPIQE